MKMTLLKAIINISTEKEIPLYTLKKMELDIKDALKRFCFLCGCRITDVKLEVIL